MASLLTLFDVITTQVLYEGQPVIQMYATFVCLPGVHTVSTKSTYSTHSISYSWFCPYASQYVVEVLYSYIWQSKFNLITILHSNGVQCTSSTCMCTQYIHSMCVHMWCIHTCRMLDEHFMDQMNELIRLCPRGRQTMLFSATMTDEVCSLLLCCVGR